MAASQDSQFPKLPNASGRWKIGLIAGATLCITALVWATSDTSTPITGKKHTSVVIESSHQPTTKQPRPSPPPKAPINRESVMTCLQHDEITMLKCAASAVTEFGIVDNLPESKCAKPDFIRKWASVILNAPPVQDSYTTLRNARIVGWDVLHPFVGCPGERRVGVIGDGGKWACFGLSGEWQAGAPIEQRPESCLVYSFGVSDDSSFEEEMHELMGCEVHSFDPTPGLNPPAVKYPSAITFHPWGLRGVDGTFAMRGVNVHGYTLHTIMKQLQHEGRRVNILKVDIEGSEWDAFNQLFAALDSDLPFDQVLVELHPQGNFNAGKVVELIVRFMERGYLPFHKELNGFYPTILTEACFISVEALNRIEPACAP